MATQLQAALHAVIQAIVGARMGTVTARYAGRLLTFQYMGAAFATTVGVVQAGFQ